MAPALRFNAMGSTCEVGIVGGRHAVLESMAKRRAEDLEQKWSRFISASELSRLNMSAGSSTAIPVSSDTYLLIDHAVAAWRWTAGRFDPTVLRLVEASGYDRSFERVGPSTNIRVERQPAPGCAGIMLDEHTQSVLLPAHVGLDPGGIGKGLAADLVSECLLEAGATGVFVNMGGDLRVAGEAPVGGWKVGIANPLLDGDLVAVVALHDHGLATSSRLIRRWTGPGEERNHLIVPSTGGHADGVLASSVIAGQAWWAEVLAKVVMVDAASRRTLVRPLGGEGLYVLADGSVEASEGFSAFDANASV